MILKTSFIIVTNSYYNNLQEINLTNYPFMYGLYKDGYSIKFDYSIINITLDRNIHIPIKNENNRTYIQRISIPIQLEKCSLNHFNKHKELFGKFDFEHYLCPKIGQNLNFKGIYGDMIRGYDILEMHLIKCENSSYFNNCKSNNEIEEYLENSLVSLIYLTNSINHYNYSYPVIDFIRSESFFISLNHVKRYYYYFSKEKYISDNGLLKNNKKEIDLFQYKYTLMDFADKELQSFYSPNTLIEINFSSVNFFTQYHRTYLKLHDVIGNFGGWTDIIFLIFNYISNYFAKKMFLLDIYNNPIFSKKKIENENKTIKKVIFDNKFL